MNHSRMTEPQDAMVEAWPVLGYSNPMENPFYIF